MTATTRPVRRKKEPASKKLIDSLMELGYITDKFTGEITLRFFKGGFAQADKAERLK